MKNQRNKILSFLLVLWLVSATYLVAAPESPPAPQHYATVANAPQAIQDYPGDPTSDIGWNAGTSDVDDIAMAFNNARTAENSQLGLSIPMLIVPSQAEWDGMSDGEKALWLINRERVDRSIAALYSLETNVNGIAQYYAQYLLDHDAWGHSEDGNSPWERLNTNASINACHDNLNVAENLAVFVTSASSIAMPIERSVYNWLYADSGSSWGHRHAILWYPYSDNSGDYGTEGFLGIGRANGGPYQGPFSSPWPFAEMIVMNIFDPCDSWDYSTAIPPRPESLAVTLRATNAITLTWDDHSMNEDGFKIERTVDGSTWQTETVTADVTTYSDTGLACGTAYTYRVRAYNAAANSAHTNLVDTSTLACPLTAPDAPSDLSVTLATTTTLSLTWTDNSGNEDGFILERSPDGSSGWAQTASLNNNITAYSDISLTCESTYYYRVFAHNGIGDSAYSDIVSGTTGTCPLMLPAAPTDLAVIALSPTSLRLNWSDNSDNENGFHIERSLEGPRARAQANEWLQIATVLTNTTAFTDTGLTENTLYYYRVLAFNNDGISTSATDAVPAHTDALINISKTADTGGLSEVALGGVVTYTLTIVNNGTEILNNITISDPLPTEVTFGTWLGHTGSAILPPPSTFWLPPVTVQWLPGDLAPGATLTLTFNVYVGTDEAFAGNHVINTAYAVADNASRVSNAAQFIIESGGSTVYLPLVLRNWPPAPYAPTLNAIDDTADGTYSLQWTESPERRAISYTLQEASDVNFSAGLRDVCMTTDQTCTVEEQSPGTYYYRVRGRNAWGNGLWSNIQSATIAGSGLYVNTQNRQAVLDFYNTYYVGANVSPDWTGSYDACAPGTVSQAFHDAVTQHINFYRAMAGMPGDITLNSEYNRKAQAAALMMSVNGTLNHTPPTSWDCYSQDGYDGASHSNLAMWYGGGSSHAIAPIYMRDAGSGNGAVGHRRWILYPKTQEMGNGYVPQGSGNYAANALYVISAAYSTPRPTTRDDFVAWPPAGYVPYTVVYARWSFSYPNADFTNATVTMINGGGTTAINIESRNGPYGESTIVWIPMDMSSSQLWPSPSSDTSYSIYVNNVMIGGQSQDFAYTVTIFNPTS